MEQYRLNARRRTDDGQGLKAVRKMDQVPGVMYGHGLTNQNLLVDARELQRIYRQAGTTSLVDLVVDDAQPIKVLIHDVQRHPTKSTMMHVDFYQVRMTEKLEADITLELIGESAAVKEQGGILVRALDKLKVECLPQDLVPVIQVDISALKTFEDRIHVSDIVAPKGITILDKPEEVVASVTPPRSEAEIEALSQKVEEDVTAVGKVEKEKSAEEESSEESTESTTPKT